MYENVLFTGGSGLLGSEIRKIMGGAFFPGHGDFDITDYKGMDAYIKGKKIDVCVHAAAFTSPPRIDQDPVEAIDVNIIGTANVVKLCRENGIRLIYISTDYVFDGKKGLYGEEDPVFPVNKYAWSKLGGECAVKMYDNSLIIRTSFSENEFPYDKGFIDQWTSRIRVSDLAEILVNLLDCDCLGTLHVGGERKTVLEYGRSISPDKEIGELSLKDVSFSAPTDTSLNIGKLKKIMKDRS